MADDSAWKKVGDLGDDFVADPSEFLESPSSRATREGQVWCRCTDLGHESHRDKPCDADVFSDGLCRDCYRAEHGSTSSDR